MFLCFVFRLKSVHQSMGSHSSPTYTYQELHYNSALLATFSNFVIFHFLSFFVCTFIISWFAEFVKNYLNYFLFFLLFSFVFFLNSVYSISCVRVFVNSFFAKIFFVIFLTKCEPARVGWGKWVRGDVIKGCCSVRSAKH